MMRIDDVVADLELDVLDDGELEVLIGELFGDLGNEFLLVGCGVRVR
jgi:hypothetical protein